jgi:hypothetical protein
LGNDIPKQLLSLGLENEANITAFCMTYYTGLYVTTGWVVTNVLLILLPIVVSIICHTMIKIPLYRTDLRTVLVATTKPEHSYKTQLNLSMSKHHVTLTVDGLSLAAEQQDIETCPLSHAEFEKHVCP